MKALLSSAHSGTMNAIADTNLISLSTMNNLPKITTHNCSCGSKTAVKDGIILPHGSSRLPSFWCDQGGKPVPPKTKEELRAEKRRKESNVLYR